MNNLIKGNFRTQTSSIENKEGKLLEFKRTPELRRNKILRLEKEINKLEKIHGFNHPEVNRLWDEVESLWQEIFKGA